MRNPLGAPPLRCCGCCCLLSPHMSQLLVFTGSHPVCNKAYIRCSTATHGVAFQTKAHAAE